MILFANKVMEICIAKISITTETATLKSLKIKLPKISE